MLQDSLANKLPELLLLSVIVHIHVLEFKPKELCSQISFLFSGAAFLYHVERLRCFIKIALLFLLLRYLGD